MAEAVLRINVTEALKKITSAEEDLRALIREAHEAIKGLKQAKRDIEATWKQVEDDVTKIIAQHVADGLKGYDTAMQSAIKTSEAAMNKRFDDLTDILLGEDARAKGLPMREFAERIAENHRQKARRVLGVESLDDYYSE